jgi:hypothetical protein
MLSGEKHRIISEGLCVSKVMVIQTLTGKRGKRGSELQDKILKAAYKAEMIYEKANHQIMEYCNELKLDNGAFGMKNVTK